MAAATIEIEELQHKWRELTKEILCKAFLVYEDYIERERDELGRFTSVTDVTLDAPTWDEWCKKIGGWSRMTYYRHFLKLGFIEKEEKTPELPGDKYRVIYADPPWKYGDDLIEGYGAVVHHYKPMPLENICALGEPLSEIINKDAVLFLWGTVPQLPDVLEVMKSWKFDYKTHFVWDKIAHNYGHYLSVRHELLMVGIKGSCLPDVKQLFDSVQTVRRKEYSSKPSEFRNIIDTIYPKGKAIELFAREKPSGRWDAWGAELD